MRTKFMALPCLLSAVVLLAGACTTKPAANTPPTAVLLAVPTAGALPLEVDFSGLLSADAGGSIVAYDWDLGDGSTETQAEFSHTYTVEDVYTVTLTVTDNMGATDTDTVDITVGPAAEPAVGCHDTTSTISIFYNGPIDSYKNAQLTNNTTGCGSDPLNSYLTVVSALDQPGATAVCQAGADPAVTGVVNLNALGFNSVPSTAWFCLNPLGFPELLEAGTCHPVGTASVKYDGPRNTLDNVTLYSGNLCEGTPGPTFTYVQHSTQPSAVTECAAVDAAFNSATNLAALIPTLPGDTYICQTV